jgi:transcriptional regulator with XRE-family HTH domain
MPARHRDQDLLRRLGARVRGLRKRRGLTQEAIAEAVGLQPETISRAEAGSISMSISHLAALARVLGVPLAELFEVETPMPPPAHAPDVLELLNLFAGLDGVGKRAALGAARGIAKEWRTGVP